MTYWIRIILTLSCGEVDTYGTRVGRGRACRSGRSRLAEASGGMSYVTVSSTKSQVFLTINKWLFMTRNAYHNKLRNASNNY